MRALVTGIDGFVGPYMVRHLLAQGDEVFGTALVDTKIENCPVHKLDVTDLSSCRAIITQLKPDIIYHLAGISFLSEADENFSLTLNVNVGGPYNLLRACEDLQHKCKMVFASSGQVYGRLPSSALPVHESQPVRPAENYSLSKAMAELLAERFQTGQFAQVIVMRPFNHIGPGQRRDFAVSSFAAQLAEIKHGLRQPSLFVGNLSARRDFSDVRDIVRGYHLAGLKGKGTYNLCSGRSVEIAQLLNELITISGLKVEIQIDPKLQRPVDVPEFYGSFERAKQELGWEPQISLHQSLQDILADWVSRIHL